VLPRLHRLIGDCELLAVLYHIQITLVVKHTENVVARYPMRVRRWKVMFPVDVLIRNTDGSRIGKLIASF